MESRKQGSRPRIQKKSEAKAKDSLSEDRHSQGQEQECSRPRPRTKHTSASALQKIKKKVFTKIFWAISEKKKEKGLHKNRPRGQGQGLQNVSSRPRTSLRTPPLLISPWGLSISKKDIFRESMYCKTLKGGTLIHNNLD